MLRYVLLATTVAVDHGVDRPVAITIPSGSILKVADDFVNSDGFVDADWDGKRVQIFGVDLHNRGELIKVRSAYGTGAAR